MMDEKSYRLNLDDVRAYLCQNYDAINKICFPLFNNSPIKYFEYGLYFDSGEGIALGTHPDLLLSCFKNNVTPRFGDFKLLTQSGLKTFYLSHSAPVLFTSDYLRDRWQTNITCASDQHLYHRLYLVERRADHYLGVGFGTNESSESILNFYMNAQCFLEKFVRYFEQQIEDLIAPSKSRKIVLPDYFDKKIIESLGSEIMFNLFDLSLPITKTPKTNDPQIHITKREQDCLELIAQGYTMKNAAKKLDISHRTVEMHLRNLKEKHGVYTRNELVDIWRELYIQA